VVVVRNAAVAQFAEVRPERALAAWPSNPRAELWSGLTRIAAATRAGQPVDRETLALLADAARKDPLAAEPFLVRGIQARLIGDEALAGNAFRAAVRRDGHSVPAHYFLADHDLRTGDAAHGLAEISVLSRMVPNGIHSLAPFVASYAAGGGDAAQIRSLFRSNPPLADETLRVLATDAANSSLVLRLGPRHPAPQSLWPAQLIDTLIRAGDYTGAERVWSSTAGVHRPAGALIYDPAFDEPKAPAPFNWALTSSALGLAERQPGGSLHVLYYGQDDGVLASQLLVLKPGSYRLRMQVAGDPGAATALTWTVTCANGSTSLLKVALAPQVDAAFTVPGNCPAQRLELHGSAPELPHTVDVTISRLSLTRSGSDG